MAKKGGSRSGVPHFGTKKMKVPFGNNKIPKNPRGQKTK